MIDSLAAHGAERSLTNLLPHLDTGGVRSTVAFLRSPDVLRSAVELAGANCIDLRGNESRSGHRHRLEQAITSANPDLVHTTLWRSDVAGRPAAHQTGVPVVTTWASTGPIHGRAVLRAKRVRTHWIDRRTARHAVRFHAVSAPVATVVGRRLGIDADRIDVIPRGREPRDFDDRAADRVAELRERHGLGGGPLVVACARHEPAKSLDTLLEASIPLLERRRDLVVAVAGDRGSTTPELERNLARHPHAERVRLLGRIDDVAALLRAASVCVVPSLVEGFPGTVVEAMMSSTPLVASDLPTIRAATGAVSGVVLVEPGDALALERGVDQMLADPLRAADATCDLRARAVENFSNEAIAKRMIAFYERSLAEATSQTGPIGATV